MVRLSRCWLNSWCLKTVLLILLLLPQSATALGGSKAEINLVDNGYEGILIAIEESVNEEPGLIDRIKASILISKF